MAARKMVIVMIAAILVTMSGTAWGTHYYVDPNGSDGADGLSWPTAFATIQKGIDANNCEVVEVNEGTYYENIDFKGVSCTVTSKNPNDWDVVEATVIDGNKADCVVLFNSNEDSNSVLTGFTITNGKAQQRYGYYPGSGIFCDGSSPKITNCIIAANNTNQTNSDGAIACYYSASPEISNCIIKNNESFYSGGISICFSSTPTVKNCIISNNSAEAGGGGLFFWDGGDATITGCTVTKNSADYGGGMVNGSSEPELTNCIFWDNEAVSYADEVHLYSGDPNWSYSDIKGCGGSGPGNWDTGFGSDDGGNIDSNPYFVNADTNDFHLAVDSPCINTGDPNGDYTGQTDIDGEQRVINGRVDMGADEALSVFNLDSNKWYDTIQAAINDSNNGDEIAARAKTYYENVDFSGKSITLRNTKPHDWDVVAATIINANDPNTADGITFDSGEDANTILKGFTVRNAYAGVFVDDGSPVISRCILQGNTAGVKYTQNSTGTLITNSKIYNNSGYGVYGHKGDANIKNSCIYNNGKGIKLVNASADVYNNTIVKNDIYGVEKGGGQGQVTISNCIIWDCNDDLEGCSATYSCIEDGDSGTGNISSDPCFVDPNIDDYHIDVNSQCVNAGDPNRDYDGETDIDGESRMMWTRVDIGADETEAYILYGMEIESVTNQSGTIKVVTTGATYVMDINGIDLYRRIDPNTNDYDDSNDGKGRQVAELQFDPNIGSLSVVSWDEGKAVIDSSKGKFTFYGDSFFLMDVNDSIDCNYTSVINAKWNAPLEADDREMDRMWTDGYGGSLHALVEGTPTLSVNDVDTTCFNVNDGNTIAFMAFPPKKFDFEGLYGTNARPFVDNLITPLRREFFLNNTYNFRQDLIDNKFGVVILWNDIYEDGPDPTLLGGNPNILGYKITDTKVPDIISLAHDNGFKVIAYFWQPNSGTGTSGDYRWRYPEGHPKEGELQDLEVTLNWMRDFQSENNFDGWYFDGGNVGDLIDDYEFMRQVRTDVDENGIIYLHASGDAWCWKHDVNEKLSDGLRSIMIHAYVDYIIAGEGGALAEFDSAYDPSLRYFTSGYGLSQVYASHTRASNEKSALVNEEINRLLAQNLNGCQINFWTWWKTHFKPAYDIRKDEYLNDPNNFVCDVNWPIDDVNDWFRMPGFDPNDPNDLSWDSNSATIHWTTNANSDSEVVYTSNGVWRECRLVGYPDGPDGSVYDPNMTIDHSITLTELDPNTFYEFRIRSNNGDENVPGEIIWGHVWSFTTEP